MRQHAAGKGPSLPERARWDHRWHRPTHPECLRDTAAHQIDWQLQSLYGKSRLPTCNEGHRRGSSIAKGGQPLTRAARLPRMSSVKASRFGSSMRSCAAASIAIVVLPSPGPPHIAAAPCRRRLLRTTSTSLSRPITVCVVRLMVHAAGWRPGLRVKSRGTRPRSLRCCRTRSTMTSASCVGLLGLCWGMSQKLKSVL